MKMRRVVDHSTIVCLSRDEFKSSRVDVVHLVLGDKRHGGEEVDA